MVYAIFLGSTSLDDALFRGNPGIFVPCGKLETRLALNRLSSPYMNDGIQQIGPYEVEAEIGRGGMGVVYRATDTRLGWAVAVKALSEDLAEIFSPRRWE